MSDPRQLSIDVRIAFPGFALDVSRDIELDGVTGLFGPSGSGKSTLLRVLAGLERRAEGSLKFAEDTWQDSSTGQFVPAHRRPVGYVFQDARLFPHLSVHGNLDYALQRCGSKQPAISADEVIAALNLHNILHRDIGSLSGGERQRVAIARTLLTQPQLMLFDEPLAGLDVRRKTDILPYLESLPRRFGVPAIYVSHSAEEMARLADNVIVLENGQVSAAGSAGRILSREALQLSSLPFEAVSILDVRVVEQLPAMHLTRVEHHGQSMTLPEVHGAAVGDPVKLLVRAGDVGIAIYEPRGISVRNVLPATISHVDVVPDSAFSIVSVDVDGSIIKAQLTGLAVQELALSAGMKVYALLKTASFDRGV